jgi:glycerol uptake facilitator-like aquaporin
MAPDFDLSRRLIVEALGTGLLVTAVVGSGIMAETLTHDLAVALLANSVATGSVLVVLITIFGEVSGAHFNPVVSAVFALLRKLSFAEAGFYIAAQIVGGLIGVVLAHAMFGLPLVEISERVRFGPGQWIAEAVATFGLVITILLGIRFRAQAVAWLVGLYIVAAYWFTASTSFANPAVAIGRTLTNTFSGIRPIDLPAFIIAQLVGAAIAAGTAGWMLATPRSHSEKWAHRGWR